MACDIVEESRDNIAIFIEEKLQNMPPIVEECSIYRVSKRLVDMNCSAYVPKMVSIGPFHHNQQNFRVIEELKLRFFDSYRCRVKDIINVEGIVKKVQSWERRAREFYSDPINMEREEFVKMMILDGCFIVEFLIHITNLFPENKNKVHPSFYKAIVFDISVELILLENQLPFFVLQNLFDLISPTSYDNTYLFKQVVHKFLNRHVLPIESGAYLLDIIQNPRHLVDFLSSYFVPLEKKNVQKNEYLPPSATRLSEAGVVFKKVEIDSTCNIMDISFKNGILKIPPLRIDDRFETWARNLLAFAQFNRNDNAIHYFRFLDELICTEKDVKLLTKEGIIVNCIGGSESEISYLFNNICKNINVIGTNYFNDVARDLNQHCERRWNRWMASLRHNYFNTPWAFISFLAASFIILLTLLQTIFSFISSFK